MAALGTRALGTGALGASSAAGGGAAALTVAFVGAAALAGSLSTAIRLTVGMQAVATMSGQLAGTQAVLSIRPQRVLVSGARRANLSTAVR